MFENENGFLGVASGPVSPEAAQLCLEVRAKLGNQADLLHQYLTLVARRLGSTEQSELVTMGLRAFATLFHLCRDLLVGEAPQTPFEQKAMDLIQKLPVIGDVVSRAELYALYLAGDYFPIAWATTSTVLDQAGEDAVPIQELDRLRGLMADICGGEPLDKLDQAIKSAWQPVSPLQLFQQGYVSEMVDFFLPNDESDQRDNLPLLLDMLDAKPTS